MEYINNRLRRQIELEKLCAQFNLPELRAGGALLKAWEFDYENVPLTKEEIDSIHSKGFSALHWLSLDLDDQKAEQYLSTTDYYRIHPANGLYSLWIDDKLTLKYLCSGTHLATYMPDYYYQILESDRIVALPDCPLNLRYGGADGIVSLLESKGLLALKSIKGDSGIGFYRMEYNGDKYFINSDSMCRDSFINTIQKRIGYIVMEYLLPNEYFSNWTVNATCGIRFLVGRVGDDLIKLDSFIRFGTSKSGYVDNLHAGGLVCFIDSNGHFGECGYQFDKTTCRVSKIEKHPDTNTKLSGDIPCWNKIVQAVNDFGEWFPQLQYLGFDFVVTNNNEIKILEINSLSGIDVSQFDKSLKRKSAWSFFAQKTKIK